MKKTLSTMLLSSFFLIACDNSKLIEPDESSESSDVIAESPEVLPVMPELSRAQSLALGLDPDISDTDGDGISDADEVGPNLDAPLDSDNDGVIDALEAGLKAEDNSQSELTLYVSAATASSLSLSQLDGRAIQISVGDTLLDPVGLLTSEDHLSNTATDLVDSEFDYPYGLFDLKVSLANSATGTVTLDYPSSMTISADSALRIRKNDGTWVAFDGGAHLNGSVEIPLTNTDGSDYDLDPAPNSVRLLTGLSEKLPTQSLVSLASMPSQINEGSGGGNIARFEVTLDKPTEKPLVVSYKTLDGTAQSPSDFTGVASGTLTILPGQSSGVIDIPVVTDTTVEDDEVFFLTLATVTPSLNGLISAAKQTASVKLLNDDLIIVPVTPADADSDSIEDSLDNCPADSNTNQLDTDSDGDGNVCDADDDNDTILDTDEATNGTDPLKADTDGDGVDDATDAYPLDATKTVVPVQSVVSISAADIAEGDAGAVMATFTVTLDAATDEDLVITYKTLDGKAESPEDYTATENATLTIPKGQLTGQIDISVVADTKPEDDETFSVKLQTISPSDNGVLSTVSKVAITLIDDDPDADSDTIEDSLDNCPVNVNNDQLDTDGDGEGNVCDADDDNDTVLDTDEATNGTDPLKADTDGDGVDDAIDELPIDPTKILTLQSAHRLLLQTTFGPTSDDLDTVQQVGAEQWVDDQLAKGAAFDSDTDDHLTHFERLVEISKEIQPGVDWFEDGIFNMRVFTKSVGEYQMATWWENALGLHPTNTKHGSDQLRQRMAYALSQLLVVSIYEAKLPRRAEALAVYYDMLLRHSFGNYRDLLGEMSRSAAMGVYLSHEGNFKTNPSTGTIPDENFARELMQLFTIGLYELNMDGSPDRDGNQFTYPDAGEVLVPTYVETDVQELAKVMTGWDLQGNRWYGDIHNQTGDYTVPLEFTPSEHEDEVAIGGDGIVTVLNSDIVLNSGDDGSGLDQALDVLFYHPNIAPHVSKHLIMRLTTSNPTSEYVARVASVFVDNGSGVRGDLKAVVRAILLDQDIRDASKIGDDDGKIKEPLIAMAQLLRAMGTEPLDGWLSDDDIPVNGVYWFVNPEEQFGQGALRSLSVFNFYTPDYVPSSSYFAQKGLVSPEMKILTDQNLLGFANVVNKAVWEYEKNYITYVKEETLTEFAADHDEGDDLIMLSDFDGIMALIKAAVDDDYANLGEDEYMVAAINVAIDYYDRLLLGGAMPAVFREALMHYLLNSATTTASDKGDVALAIIKDTIYMIVTSDLFMVQK